MFGNRCCEIAGFLFVMLNSVSMVCDCSVIDSLRGMQIIHTRYHNVRTLADGRPAACWVIGWSVIGSLVKKEGDRYDDARLIKQ